MPGFVTRDTAEAQPSLVHDNRPEHNGKTCKPALRLSLPSLLIGRSCLAGKPQPALHCLIGGGWGVGWGEILEQKQAGLWTYRLVFSQPGPSVPTPIPHLGCCPGTDARAQWLVAMMTTLCWGQQSGRATGLMPYLHDFP